MDFREELVEILSTSTGLPQEKINLLLTVPSDSLQGDFALPCFFLGKDAPEEAKKLKERLPLPPFLEKAEAVGPYLNFCISASVLTEKTLKAIYTRAQRYGQSKNLSPQRIVVEYCGPNTNKPLHLGHLRNMALGNALCRVLSFVDHKVCSVNIINDRGIHICQSMLAYQKWGNRQLPSKKGDHFVGEYYVLFSQKAKEEEKEGKNALQQEAQEMLRRWEEGDPEVRELWQKMNSWVLVGFAQTYQRFGVQFEKEYAESKYYSRGKELVQEGVKKNIFQKDSTGAIIAPLKKYQLPDKVLLRGDETSLYITQDLFLATLRYRDFKFQKMIYVVASEQRLHFQQLFKILELLGLPYAPQMYHLSYGLVNLPSGRMKSREGTIVDADTILDEVAALAAEEVRKRYPSLPPLEMQQRADAIALGALKFFMLHTDAVRDITYHPEASLSFEGETGPYLQYTHARACSLIRKAAERHFHPAREVHFPLLTLPEELAVVRLLARFPEVVEKAARTYQLHPLTVYLLSLAQAFNTFYHQCPVLEEEKALTKVRLLLVDATRQVLANGLSLLGIKALEEM